MRNEMDRETLLKLGEAEDKCRSISVGGMMFDDSASIDPAIIAAAERIKRRAYEESNEGYDEWCRDCERIGHLGAELILQQQSGKPIPVVMSERLPARMIEDDEPADILSQPPTPQALVEVLGWDGHLGHCIRSPKQPHPHYGAEIVYLPKCPAGKDAEWRIQRTDIFGPDIYFPTPSTLRDVVDLCRVLGIPCEVKRAESMPMPEPPKGE